MIKFNNFPPQKPEDVEFTDEFWQFHQSVDSDALGALVASAILENMPTRHVTNAHVIIDGLFTDQGEVKRDANGGHRELGATWQAAHYWVNRLTIYSGVADRPRIYEGETS